MIIYIKYIIIIINQINSLRFNPKMTHPRCSFFVDCRRCTLSREIQISKNELNPLNTVMLPANLMDKYSWTVILFWLNI